jgi:hypothetical protein
MMPVGAQMGKLIYCTRTIPEMEKVRGIVIAWQKNVGLLDVSFKLLHGWMYAL